MSIQDMKMRAYLCNNLQPFMIEQFNISGFHTSVLKNRRNVLLCIIDALIDGLSTKQFLPKFILVIPDHDIIDMLGFDEPGFTAQIERCVSWLAKNFTRDIENQKDVLTMR